MTYLPGTASVQPVQPIGIVQTEQLSHVTSNQPCLPPVAKTTEQIQEYTNANNRGCLLIVNVTLDPATAAVTPWLEYKDATTGNWIELWHATGAGIVNAVGTYKYLFYPVVYGTAPAVFTDVFPGPLPRTFRFRFAVADGQSLTYSATVCMLN